MEKSLNLKGKSKAPKKGKSMAPKNSRVVAVARERAARSKSVRTAVPMMRAGHVWFVRSPFRTVGLVTRRFTEAGS